MAQTTDLGPTDPDPDAYRGPAGESPRSDAHGQHGQHAPQHAEHAVDLRARHAERTGAPAPADHAVHEAKHARPVGPTARPTASAGVSTGPATSPADSRSRAGGSAVGVTDQRSADDDLPPAGQDPEDIKHWRHRFFSPYALAVILSLLALSPFIILTTATEALTSLIQHSLGTTETVLQVGSGMANAGYALGAVVAADFAQRFVQRHLFLVYEALFVVASVIAAVAPNAPVYLVGHILQGAATGLLLVGALPPLILRFPPERLPLTVAFVNIGLFGAISIGPFLGNLFADLGTWRWVFVGAAVLGGLGWLAGWFGYEKWAPMNPDLPVDGPVFPLAVAATALPFLGSALGGKFGFSSPWFWAPIAAGVFALLVLVRHELRRRREPLLPVNALSSSLPVAGTLGAMLGGGAFVAALSIISITMSERGVGLLHAGLLLLPLVAGVAVASVLFRRYVARVGLPDLAASGLLAVVAGVLVALPATFAGGPLWVVPISAVLLGFGAGSSVAPALFLAGMGVEAMKIGRAFALIELLRSEAAFLIAPVLSVYAAHVGGLGGLRQALIVSLVIAAAGLILGVFVYVGSGTRRHPARIAEWLDNQGTALHSPRLLARLRGLPTD